MGAFSRSWEITKTTLSVMKKDKEIFIFPILSIIVAICFLALFAVFVAITGIVSLAGGISVDFLVYFFLFILYLFLSAISVFFSVCVVYTASMHFSGKDAKLGESISFAFGRLGKIFSWAILSATVGVIFKILENAARRAKGAGKIFFSLFNYVVGALWSISTIFVVQGIVYKNLGPFASIKDSLITLKKTWGESLIKYVGFGFVQGLFISLGLIIFIPLIFVLFASPLIVLFLLSFLVIYVVSVAIFFNLADSVFNTALYIYANTGRAPEGFSEEQLNQTFIPKGA